MSCERVGHAPRQGDNASAGGRLGFAVDQLAMHLDRSLHHRDRPPEHVDSADSKSGRRAPKEPKTVKNRMHFDIEVPDIETEAARLVDLGATRVSECPCSEQGSTWILKADPKATSSASATPANP